MEAILNIQLSKRSIQKKKKLLIFISILLLTGLLIGFCAHISQRVQLSELKDIRDYYKHNSDRTSSNETATCYMPGCENTAYTSISHTFTNKDERDVTITIPNAANFTISGDAYISKDKVVGVDKQDVYIITNKGNGNYIVSEDEILTTQVYETNHMQMFSVDFSGKYCSDHLAEAAKILVDEIESSFNKNIIYFLCVYLAPYNFLAMPLLISLLYWLMIGIPNDKARADAIREGRVYCSEATCKDAILDQWVSFQAYGIIYIALMGVGFLVGLAGDAIIWLTIKTILWVVGIPFGCAAIAPLLKSISRRKWLSAVRSRAKKE